STTNSAVVAALAPWMERVERTLPPEVAKNYQKNTSWLQKNRGWYCHKNDPEKPIFKDKGTRFEFKEKPLSGETIRAALTTAEGRGFDSMLVKGPRESQVNWWIESTLKGEEKGAPSMKIN